jgi:glycosyltransferase involved in cell wall biosynthesis
VATGKKHEYYFTDLEPEIKKLGLEKNIFFTDMVSDADLIGLYNSTKLSVIPTLYEAGSGPYFESIRYKIPVITSDATTLPEHVDNPEFIFDPHKPESIAKMIDTALNDPDFRKRNLENSERRLKYYEEIDYLKGFIDFYKEARLSK